MAIELNDVSSGYSTGVINSNFQTLENYINQYLLHRDGVELGQANQMETDLDMNGFGLLNLGVDSNNSDSILTLGVGNDLYINKTGDSMTGPLNVLEGSSPSHAVAYSQLQAEASARTSADASLQSQLTGDIPVLASAFSEVSWHGQQITNSVNIPDNKNAWTIGPSISIAPGQTITVGDNSYWTIVEASGGGGTGGSVSSVNGQIGTVMLNTDDIPEGSGNFYYPSADEAKLATIESGAQVNTVTSVAGKTGAVSLVKGDVGLGNVENFPVASQAQAEAGTDSSTYLTPERGTQLVTALLQSGSVTVDYGVYP